MRNEIKLSDEQIEKSFDKIGACLDISDITFTRDTIADFEDGALNVMNKFKHENALEIETKTKLIFVVDFGSVRASYVTSI